MSESAYETAYRRVLSRRHLVHCGLIWNVLASLALAWWAPDTEWQFVMIIMAGINGALLWHSNRP